MHKSSSRMLKLQSARSQKSFHRTNSKKIFSNHSRRTSLVQMADFADSQQYTSGFNGESLKMLQTKMMSQLYDARCADLGIEANHKNSQQSLDIRKNLNSMRFNTANAIHSCVKNDTLDFRNLNLGVESAKVIANIISAGKLEYDQWAVSRMVINYLFVDLAPSMTLDGTNRVFPCSKLHLANNNLTEEGLKHLSRPIANHPRLIYLNLENSNGDGVCGGVKQNIAASISSIWYVTIL